MVDDHSIDNSVKFSEKYQKLDKRIILIKNKKNKGTFISRNLGVLYSKGKYLILPDPDDILSKNSLRALFYLTKKYDYDLIRFNMYLKGKTITFKNIVDNLKDNPVYQPKLSTYIYYGNNELESIDWFINNKFIKRVIYIEAINSLNKFYANMYMTFLEDSIINYLIYRTSKSFYFVKKIGYYYIKSIHSITKNLFKISKLNIQFIFIYLKFIFENSKNNKYERDMSNELFTLLFKNFKLVEKLRSSYNNLNSSLYKQTINQYKNNKYIYNDIKKLLKEYISLLKN